MTEHESVVTIESMTMMLDAIGAMAQAASDAIDGDGRDQAESIATLLRHVRNATRELKMVDDELVERLSRAMPDDTFTADGAVFVRRWGKDRTKWDNERLIGAVRPALLFDRSSGEPLPGDAVWANITAVFRLSGDNARVRALRDLGVNADEFAEQVRGRVSIAIEG